MLRLSGVAVEVQKAPREQRLAVAVVAVVSTES